MEPADSATVVANNADLLTEILVRVPVKPLMTFKCVSKEWLSFISGPQFCRNHVLRGYHHHTFPSYLLLTPSPEMEDNDVSTKIISMIPLPLKSSNDEFSLQLECDFTIKQSCNGLLLLQGVKLNGERHTVYYCVCNPATSQIVNLDFKGTDVYYLFLAFDPLISSHFKVLSFAFMGEDVSPDSDLQLEDFNIFMYLSETGQWNDLGLRIPHNYMQRPSSMLSTGSGAYVNGGIYWHNEYDDNSMYFDLENQCLNSFPMPSNIEYDQDIDYFGASGGHLHMTLVKFGYASIYDLVDILELKEDNSEWLVKFRVDLTPMLVAFPDWNLHLKSMSSPFFYVLSIVCQNDENDSQLVFFIHDTIMSYNFVNCTFTKLTSFQPLLESEPSRLKEVFQYTESLCWVGAHNKCLTCK
ncbi:hypothetical protein RIF29_19633 [Crotalaria pallida]|uniref:F-box domain-containing protein n=1 Tax=Crotalaria pallida TaxID=3830 RepID=A0AAN9F2T9_CROPI